MSGTASAGNDKVTLRLGYFPNITHATALVGVKDGIFAGMEGEVKDILEAKGQVRVELTIFGRPTSVELEYWQVEQL